jgi:hypothetical protein
MIARTSEGWAIEDHENFGSSSQMIDAPDEYLSTINGFMANQVTGRAKASYPLRSRSRVKTH